MKIYLYIRLSSADDDLKYKTESESISHQRALLHQFINSRREFDSVPVEEFTDDGYTGTNADRPAFERMIEQLKSGEPATVICKDFSRFFRDYTEIGDYLERIFPFLGVRFISVNDRYDSDDYKGTTAGMEVVMKYIIYSYYSKDLSQKVKAAMRVRKNRGEFIGVNPPYGYMKDPADKHHLLPDPESSVIVRRIFDMALQGIKPGEIATQLNEDGIKTPGQYYQQKFPESGKYKNISSECHWDYHNIIRILQRLEYTGAVVAYRKIGVEIGSHKKITQTEKDWVVIPNRHEAIVTKVEYDKVQSAMNHKGLPVRKKQEYLLRSLVCCGICGRKLTRNTSTKRISYECRKSIYASKTGCPVGEHFYEKDLETAILNSLREILTLLVEHADEVQKAARKAKGSVENLRLTLQQLENDIKRNSLVKMEGYERYADGAISRDDFLKLRDRLAGELEKLTEQDTEIKKRLNDLEPSDSSGLSVVGEQAKQFLREGDITNRMLLQFIDHVDVYSGMRIDIKYRFSDELMNHLMALKSGSDTDKKV